MNPKQSFVLAIGSQPAVTFDLVGISRNSQQSLIYREVNPDKPVEHLRTAVILLPKKSKNGVLRTGIEVTTPVVATDVSGKAVVTGQHKTIMSHFFAAGATPDARGNHLKTAFTANAQLRDAGAPSSDTQEGREYSAVLAGNANIVV